MENVTVRTRRFLHNPLLCRKQFMIDVVHPNRDVPEKKLLREKIASLYKVKDPNLVVVMNLKSAFGGGKSEAFGLLYDDLKSLKKYEKKYVLVRQGLVPKVDRPGRRGTKETKNRKKKVRGTAKAKVSGGKKK